MPRPVNVVPSYLHHTATGQAYCRVGDVQHYLGLYNTVESRRAYARLLLSLDARLTVAGLVEQYSTFAAIYYRRPDGTASFEVRDTALSLRPVVEAFGEADVDAFRAGELREVREAMVRTLSRRVVNQRIGRVVRCWRWGVEQGVVDPATLQSLESVRGLAAGRSAARERDRVLPVEEAVYIATLPHLPPTPRAVCELLWHTGMRPGEACSVAWSLVDTSGDVWLYRPASHKMSYQGSERVVAIGAKGQEVLGRYPRDRDGIFAGYRVDSLGLAVRRAASRAGVEPWHPNQIRHSFATRVRTTLGLEAAQVALGHLHADVTQVYAERNLSLAHLVALRLG